MRFSPGVWEVRLDEKRSTRSLECWAPGKRSAVHCEIRCIPAMSSPMGCPYPQGQPGMPGDVVDPKERGCFRKSADSQRRGYTPEQHTPGKTCGQFFSSSAGLVRGRMNAAITPLRPNVSFATRSLCRSEANLRNTVKTVSGFGFGQGPAKNAAR
jgi:hypothetical protein